jgi:putative hydrolase of the HAD superfamily
MLESPIKVLALDADDTLWANEHNYRQIEQAFCRYFSSYGTPESNYALLMELERTWMLPNFGYGAKAFTLTMMECALQLKERAAWGENIALTAEEVRTVADYGKFLMTPHIEIFSGVRESLERLKASGRWKLVLASKGDLQEQMDKLKASGLESYFDHIQIMVEKDVLNYQRLCRTMNCLPEELLMVGNSFKSDIAPVLELGGAACYIPSEFTWFVEVVEEFDHPHLLRCKTFEEFTERLLKE